MSTRTSTTNIDTECADPIVLEKVESQRAPGELTIVNHFGSAATLDKRCDESNLEKGSETEVGGRPAITHRPTGFKVPLSCFTD